MSRPDERHTRVHGHREAISRWRAGGADLILGGWQTGNFPAGWHEWNDRYRDRVRNFWLSDIDYARRASAPVGIGGFAKGGDFNRKHANRIMRYRIIAQAVAVIIIVGWSYLRSKG